MNVLFHDDVAGKSAVIHPVAKAALHGRGVRPSRPVQVPSEIVRFAANNFTQRPAVNSLHHFNERRAVANLESHVQAQLPLGALPDFNYLQCPRHIHGHGLFQIYMFARRDGCL